MNARSVDLEYHGFTVHYQPIVDLTTGAMVSVEALLRRQHPVRDIVDPAEFIPLAADAAVLEQACRQLVEWHRIQKSVSASVELSVAVNLSERDLLDTDITGLVGDVLKRTGLSPGDLWLEVTESVFREGVASFASALARLKEVGVRWSIDHFGTGYSILGLLQRFPVDAVKVDRSFIEGVATEPGEAAIVRAIIAMADGLGLGVTADGVETHDQLAKLKKLRCPRAQGDHLARPMPVDALTQLVLESHHWPVD